MLQRIEILVLFVLGLTLLWYGGITVFMLSEQVLMFADISFMQIA